MIYLIVLILILFLFRNKIKEKYAFYSANKTLKKANKILENKEFNNATNIEDDCENLYKEAIEIVLRDKKASASHIQRILRIGYNRAAYYIERMEIEEIVTRPDRNGYRTIIGNWNNYIPSNKIMTTDEQLKQFVKSKFEEHKEVLIRKYYQLTYKDDYGIEKTEKFENEMNYFMENVLKLTDYNIKINGNFIKSYLIEQIKKNKEQYKIELTNNPYDFEILCAQILKNNGWEAEATQKSGDMGVDVVASKDNIKIVLQCKLYSNPVGNHAVQEILAGKEYYKADFAGVVSNNTYTTSARRLAKNCNILLLNTEDLPSLYEKII